MCSRIPHTCMHCHTHISSVTCRFTQCKVRGECVQPFPPPLHALSYPCIALQCCLLPQQLRSSIRGFSSGVCHVMNTTLVGCNPGMMEVLMHQAFCFGLSVLAELETLLTLSVASDQGRGHSVPPPPEKHTQTNCVSHEESTHLFGKIWTFTSL